MRTLIRAGVEPLILVRDPETVPRELRGLVRIARADSRVPEQVAAATRGGGALYWVSPSPVSDDPLGEYAEAAEALTSAVTDNGIRRVVLQSSVGAELRHGAGEIDALAATEVALDALGVDTAHLRCGYFFSNLGLMDDAIRAGVLPTVLPVDAEMPWVAPRDIAEVAAGLLLNRDWSGRTVRAVHGPVDLSWSRVAEILSSVLRREIQAERIGDDELLAGYLQAGMARGLADAVLAMSTGLREGFTPEQPRTVASTTEMTLAAWAQDELVGA